MGSFPSTLVFYLQRSSALVGYAWLAYLLAGAVLIGPLAAASIAGVLTGNFFPLIFLFGFVIYGLKFSIPVALIAAFLVVVLQRSILEHLLGWSLFAPFLATGIFVTASNQLGSHPAASLESWPAFLLNAQTLGYGAIAFAWSAVAAGFFYSLVKRSEWL